MHLKHCFRIPLCNGWRIWAKKKSEHLRPDRYLFSNPLTLLSQDNCPGRHLPLSGFHDVEIHQLPASSVERTQPDSDLEKEASSLQEQVKERQRWDMSTECFAKAPMSSLNIHLRFTLWYNCNLIYKSVFFLLLANGVNGVNSHAADSPRARKEKSS